MTYATSENRAAIATRTPQSITTQDKPAVLSPNQIKSIIVSVLPDFKGRSLSDLGLNEVLEACRLLSDTARTVVAHEKRHDKASELYEAAGYVAAHGEMVDKACELYHAAAEEATESGNRTRRNTLLHLIADLKEQKGDHGAARNWNHTAHHAYEEALRAVKTVDEDGSVSRRELTLLEKYRGTYIAIKRRELEEREPHVMQFLGVLDESISGLRDLTSVKR